MGELKDAVERAGIRLLDIIIDLLFGLIKWIIGTIVNIAKNKYKRYKRKKNEIHIYYSSQVIDFCKEYEIGLICAKLHNGRNSDDLYHFKYVSSIISYLPIKNKYLERFVSDENKIDPYYSYLICCEAQIKLNINDEEIDFFDMKNFFKGYESIEFLYNEGTYYFIMFQNDSILTQQAKNILFRLVNKL